MSAGQPPLDSSEIHRLTPVIGPGYTYGSVTDKISAIVLTRPTSFGWYVGFLIAFSLMGMLTVAIGWLVIKGTGIWGINIPIGWGFAIVNFVWWIGIGHAGTLISAILFLLNQKWRTSINRFAEAMTLFAVACAGIFPLIHTGRPWMAYYMFPYPSTDSGPGNAARSLGPETPENHLRHAVHGLARLRSPLASLSVGLFASRRTRDAAGSLRAHRCEL